MQQHNVIINQFFTQILLGVVVILASIFCELFSIHVLPIGFILGGFLLVKGISLYIIWKNGAYIQVTGKCITVEKNKKKSKATFRLENGLLIDLTVKDGVAPIANENYVFFMKQKHYIDRIHSSDILAWSIT